MTLPKILPRVGERINVSTNVTNAGNYVESAQVNLYLNSILTASASLTLQPHQTSTLVLSWNSTSPGRLPLSITIAPIPNELLNSNVLNSTLSITFRGDVNRDGRVDVSDLAVVSASFGSVSEGANYNPAADLNQDGRIDTSDLAICGSDFGKIL